MSEIGHPKSAAAHALMLSASISLPSANVGNIVPTGRSEKTVGTVRQWKMGAPKGVRGRPFTLSQWMVKLVP